MTSPKAPGFPPKSPNAWAVIAIVAVFALAAAYLGSKGNRPPPAPSTLSAALATPTALPGEAKPAYTAFMWDEEEDGPERTFNVDGLVLTLSGRLMADGRAPLIKVTGPKEQTVELVGETRPGAAYAEFGVGKLDAASLHSQVLFTSFSGGAHCCAVIQVSLPLRIDSWHGSTGGPWRDRPILNCFRQASGTSWRSVTVLRRTSSPY